jgi:hypothetical protein
MPSSSTVPAELGHSGHEDLGVLRSGVLNHHSSWAALCICLRERPVSFRALLRIVGVTHGQVKPFNACADAYSVYEDGCLRGKIKL